MNQSILRLLSQCAIIDNSIVSSTSFKNNKLNDCIRTIGGKEIASSGIKMVVAKARCFPRTSESRHRRKGRGVASVAIPPLPVSVRLPLLLLVLLVFGRERCCSSFVPPHRSATERKSLVHKRRDESIFRQSHLPIAAAQRKNEDLGIPKLYQNRRASFLWMGASDGSFSPNSTTLLEEDFATTPNDDASGMKDTQKEDDGRGDTIVASIVDFFADNENDSTKQMAMGNGADAASTVASGNGRNHKRANIQLVAGFGKTSIAWKAMERLFLSGDGDDRTSYDRTSPAMKIGLYVTPRLHLVDQALKDRDDHGIIMASPLPSPSSSSSTTRTRITKSNVPERPTIDTLIVASRSIWKSEKRTTSVDDIMAFLGDGGEDENGTNGATTCKIFVTTYDSLPRIGEAIHLLNSGGATTDCRDDERNSTSTSDISIDFAIFDEAHEMEGLTTSKKNGRAYGLYDSNIDIQNRLFMTGTPRNYTDNAEIVKLLPTGLRPDGTRAFIPINKANDSNDDMSSDARSDHGLNDNNDKSSATNTRNRKPRIRSFANKSIFGTCLATKSYHEAVEQDITLPISLVGVETNIFSKHDDSNRNTDGILSDKDYYLPISIQAAFRKLPVRHALSFHSTIQRSKEFLERARKVLNSHDENAFALFNVDHSTTPEQRLDILKKSNESPRSLISNCRVFSTGVDNASWDLVVIADPV